MKSLLAMTTILALSTPAWAGDPTPAPVEAPIAVDPVPVANTGGNWTGGYAGLGFGNLDVDGSGAANGDDLTFGAHVGYDYDFGQFVLGGELELDGTDLELNGAGDVDSVLRLKLRGGYDLGSTLLYVTAGVADVETSLGSDSGAFGGVGLAYQVNERVYVGGELLHHEFNNISGSGVDADATSIGVRGGIRF